MKHLVLLMARKKWTPLEATEEVLKTREKKKWQIALRRYVVERQPSSYYAPFFGLDIENFRKWIELDFSDGTTWEDFGTTWNLEHILPVQYFDFNNQADLALCWNFINIRADYYNQENAGNVDLVSCKAYYSEVARLTGLSMAKKMIKKIDSVIDLVKVHIDTIEFINQHKALIEFYETFDSDDFLRINKGESPESLLLEKEILKKFGS